MQSNMQPATKRKGKKKVVVFIILAVIIVSAIGIGWLFCSPGSPLKKEHDEAANVPIKAVDFTHLKDGVFIGEYEGGMYKWRVNKVGVTVASGKVTNIKLLESPNMNAKSAPTYETIYKKIIETQSLQVDTVSGATLDTKAYLKGVEQALIQAEK